MLIYSGVLWGDVVIQAVMFLMLLIPIFLIIFASIYIVRLTRRLEARADERLKLDKENVAFQQQQVKTIEELNERMKNIEKTLKDVE